MIQKLIKMQLEYINVIKKKNKYKYMKDYSFFLLTKRRRKKMIEKR